MIPDNMMPNQTAHAVHLRAPSTSGGKDWVGVVTTDPFYGGKLWIINGKTKDVLSGGGHGRAVKAPGTERSLSDAVSKKLDEGYTRIDEYEARNGWKTQLKATKAATATPFPQKEPQTSQPVFKTPIITTSITDSEDAGPTMCW